MKQIYLQLSILKTYVIHKVATRYYIPVICDLFKESTGNVVILPALYM